MVTFDAEEMFWKNVYTECDAMRKIVWGSDAKTFNKDTDKTAAFITAMLDITKEDVVLDYGCGLGRLMKAVVPNAKHVVGLDVSNSIIAMSDKYLDGVKNVNTIHCSSIAESPVGDTSIDKIYSFIVMQHVSKYKCFFILENLKKYLTPGGKGLFQFPDLMKSDNTYRGYAQTNVFNGDNNCSLHFWTKEEAKKIFEMAGWKVVDIVDDVETGTDFWVVAE